MKKIVFLVAAHPNVRLLGALLAAVLLAFAIGTLDHTLHFVRSIETPQTAEANRNSSGTMQKVNGPYTSGSVISSALVNARLADIENEITDSLSRSNKGAMLQPLGLANGSVTAPALAFGSEPGSGLYKIGTGDIGFSILGTKELELTSSLFTVTPDAKFSARLGIGVSPSTLLDVEGPHVANKGLGYFKGVGDHGYIAVDTSAPTTKEVGIIFGQSGTGIWNLYMPANTTELRFFRGGIGDILSMSSTAIKALQPLTIGSSGTAISASYRGTVSLGAGTVNAGTCTAGFAVALTGAAASADCEVNPTNGAPRQLSYTCSVQANQCDITVCNPQSGSNVSLSGSAICRVNNP